jgi:hypothetical protein
MAKLDLAGLNRLLLDLKAKLVPQTRRVNGQALSADVTITAESLGALTEVPPATISTYGTVRAGSLTATLTTTWTSQSDSKYSQAVTFTGLKAGDDVELYLVIPTSAASADVASMETEFAKIFGGVTSANTVTVWAKGDTPPSVALNVLCKVVSNNG